MAAHKKPLHPLRVEEVRAKIRSALLIKRLEDYAVTPESDENFANVSMTDGQVRSALGLLKKIIPDLATTTVSGDDKSPLRISVEWAKAE